MRPAIDHRQTSTRLIALFFDNDDHEQGPLPGNILLPSFIFVPLTNIPEHFDNNHPYIHQLTMATNKSKPDAAIDQDYAMMEDLQNRLTPYEISRLRSILLATGQYGPPQRQPHLHGYRPTIVDDAAALSTEPDKDNTTNANHNRHHHMTTLAEEQEILASISTDSDYPHFPESTHAWAVFADDPRKSAGWQDRMVGLFIIAFQLYTYAVFAAEAIEDYQLGVVPVMIRNDVCFDLQEQIDVNGNKNNNNNNWYDSNYQNTLLQCEANRTNNRDAFVAFFMLGIFLASDMIQAIRVLQEAPMTIIGKLFAALAFLEVMAAFGAACISVSYNLYIGEVTDAIEVGVGLLFIRELSQKTYAAVRNGKSRRYSTFFTLLLGLIAIGMCMDPICEQLFATHHLQNEND